MEDTERQEPSRAHAKHRLTKDRKQLFLEELARTGVIAEAARIASPHSKAGALSTFYTERSRDPEFAAAWDDAVEHATGIVEREAFRRAVEGWDEPTRFGPVRKHSDRLLELLLKARNPLYHERRKYEVDAKTEVTEKPLGLCELSSEKQELLRQLLQPGDDTHCPDLGPADTSNVSQTTTEPSDDSAKGSLTEEL